VLAWRYGWLVRHWTVARVAHGHTVRFAQSPFDRRAGMASLFLDTAGADQSAFQLQLKYLPEATARELFARLRPHIGSPPGVDDPRGSTSPPRPATAAGA
jgi:putative membrane protein